MAIKPEECGKLTNAEIAALENAERIIDARLKRDYQGEPVGYSVELETWVNLSPRAKVELLDRYRAAGWHIFFKPGDDYGSTTMTFSSDIGCG